MQARKIILLFLIIIVYMVNGCAWTNKLLRSDGEYGNKDTLPVDPFELVEMANYCNTSYRRATAENKLYEIRKDEFSYHVKQDQGVTILIFRGTKSAKNALVTDLDFRVWKDDGLTDHWCGTEPGHCDINLHRGFKDAAMFILEDIDDNYKLEQVVYLTGHSMGGAVAQIIGLWLDQRGHDVQIYTFGSPKVSTTFFENRPTHFRVSFGNDPVPFLPPYPFLHSGIQINPETLEWDESHEEESFFEIDGRDHSIQEYYDVLEEHIFPKLCDECK